MSAPPRDFFVVAAQVIPLLLLVGVVEHAGTPAPERDNAPRHAYGGPVLGLALIRLGMTASMVFGEVAALSAVATGSSRLAFQTTAAGLAAGGISVVDRILDHEFPRLTQTMRTPYLLAVIVLFLGAVLGSVIVPAVLVF